MCVDPSNLQHNDHCPNVLCRQHEIARKQEEAKLKQEEILRHEQRKKAYSEAQRREAER